MARACLPLLAAYAALFAAYAWWLGHGFPSPGKYIGGGIMALVTGGSLGALYNALVAYREWSLVAAARHGLPWSDGRWTAVAGEIHPVAESLIAPFSGQECVLCEYDVASQHSVRASNSDSDSKPGSDFVGFLMNPSVVRGSVGELRLLGFPNLVGFGERICDSAEAVNNARAFFLSTEFENLSGLKLVTIFSAIKAAWTDDDGLVRKNLRLGKTTPQQLFPSPGDATIPMPPQPTETALDKPLAAYEDLDDEDLDDDDDDIDDEGLDDNLAHLRAGLPLLKEKRVKVGETVCAFGIYSGEKRGLLPGGLGADVFIKLVRGRPAEIEQTARSQVFRNLLGGILGLILVHLAGWAVLLAAAAK
jgi:hypothetical protein